MNTTMHGLDLIHYFNFSPHLLTLTLVDSIKSCNGFYQIIKVLMIHSVPWLPPFLILSEGQLEIQQISKMDNFQQ